MNFRKVKQILNRKLIEIWSYRKYTSDEEKNADAISKKIYFIQKIESQAVFAEEEYTAWRRLFTYKHIEKKQKERLMRRCRNLELRIKLDEEINKIQIRLKKIYKNLQKTFREYCAWREQILEFRGRYYDLYDIHCKYYEEVLEFIFNLYYKKLIIFFF